MQFNLLLFSLEFSVLTHNLPRKHVSIKIFPSSWSTVNNNEAKKSTFADVHDRRISSDENGASSDCIPKDDPILAADSVIDDQKETRTVVNETLKKEKGMEEGANNTSNQQSSTQKRRKRIKSKKKRKKKSSKGALGSAETINKSGEEIKIGKEGTSFLEGMLSVKCILDVINFLPLFEGIYPPVTKTLLCPRFVIRSCLVLDVLVIFVPIGLVTLYKPPL